MKSPKRKLDIVVISDVHLGTYGCHAKELLLYLKSIRPRTIILNGDFIDIWQFSKRYWPKSHMKVIKYILGLVAKGVKVQYVTGNHDEMLRKFVGFKLGSFSIANKLLLNLPGNEKAWIFHGDVFDVTMQHSKGLAKLGAVGYDFLILLNQAVNFLSERVFRKGKVSLSKRIKNSVKSALKFINDFEQTAAAIGIANNYQYVICGHIHQPQSRIIETPKGSIHYLNSGDWIENLTSLEYVNGNWSVYHFDKMLMQDEVKEEEVEMNTSKLFDSLLLELTMGPTA
ncbi:MAG TPA: UDP-2,3-diacylglucosamine diphosphatase [Chitinophagaceae bacterium]|nr:UDP-2,3-diacylglucosamine diphosphatase [Chitinophagaceae bacterium]